MGENTVPRAAFSDENGKCRPVRQMEPADRPDAVPGVCAYFLVFSALYFSFSLEMTEFICEVEFSWER